MVEEILAKVKTPFSDENIEKWMHLFLSLEGDFRQFYSAINNFDRDAQSEEMNSFAKRLYGNTFVTSQNTHWKMIRSKNIVSDNEFDCYENFNSNHYRIYLNLPEDKRISFIKQYIVACEEQGVPLHFKFSLCDKRYDQFMALCPCEEEEQFEKIVKIVEMLTSGIELGPLPEMVGKYKENIGIVESRKTYSFTEDIIFLIEQAMSISILENLTKLKVLTDNNKFHSNFENLQEKSQEFEEATLEYGRYVPSLYLPHLGYYSDSSEYFGILAKLVEIEPEIIQTIIKDFKELSIRDYGVKRSTGIIFSQNTEDKITMYRDRLTSPNNAESQNKKSSYQFDGGR